MRFSTLDKEGPPFVSRAINRISSITASEYPLYSSSITFAFADKNTDNLSSIFFNVFSFNTVSVLKSTNFNPDSNSKYLRKCFLVAIKT